MSIEIVKTEKIFETKDATKTPVRDGFANFVAKLGVSPLGENPKQNMLSAGFYEFNLITRNRIQLEAAYRGSWIVGRVVDSVANDMVRAGINITTNDDPENVELAQQALHRLKVWSSTRSTIRWGRLYGGSLGVMQIEGQSLESPLDPESIGKDQFKGLVVYDRWQVYPALDKLINSGPDIGLPEFYDIVLGANLNDPSLEPGGQETNEPNQRVRVHHTRCLRMIGLELPFWQAITEMMWGESVCERMWDRLIEFDTATASVGNLVNRAYLRMVGVDGLREIIAAGGKGQENLVRAFEMMSELQKNEGITLLDKNDEYKADTYTFAGLSDVMLQFAQQVSGSAEIPLIILFNQTPTGLNSTGETDIRIYYDSIKAKQEEQLRNFFTTLLKVIWRSLTGHAAPDDLAFTFNPLWQMSAVDRATVSKTTTDTIIEAHEAGLLSASAAMKELKQASDETGLFTHISDEDIQEAENESPPEPESIVSTSGAGTPGEGPTSPLDKLKQSQNKSKKKSGDKQYGEKEETLKTQLTGEVKDSAWRKIKRWVTGDRGVEATIKEFEKGTLKSSSGKKVTSKKQALAIGYSEEGKDASSQGGGVRFSTDQKKIQDWLRKK